MPAGAGGIILAVWENMPVPNDSSTGSVMRAPYF